MNDDAAGHASLHLPPSLRVVDLIVLFKVNHVYCVLSLCIANDDRSGVYRGRASLPAGLFYQLHPILARRDISPRDRESL